MSRVEVFSSRCQRRQREQVARQLVGLIPVVGIAPKVAVAYGGTWAIGQAVVLWATTGQALTMESVGHFFDVMTNGYGAMTDYSEQVSPQDRWAIAAYIRALQLSQHASESDVPPGEQIAQQPPPGVRISPPYDTQGATAATSAPAP